jgi:hypothetical protein
MFFAADETSTPDGSSPPNKAPQRRFYSSSPNTNLTRPPRIDINMFLLFTAFPRFQKSVVTSGAPPEGASYASSG